jgi:hypothetical protein
MPALPSEYACPVCPQGKGNWVQIFASAGELSCSKGLHRWNDTQSFLDLNPQMVFKVTVPKALPQENHTPFNLKIPISLKTALDAKYGDKAGPTMLGILWQMLEGEAMIVPETDIQRLAERLGKRPANSSELIGLVYSKVCEADDAKDERDTALKDLKAYEGMYPGRVVVDLGENYSEAREKAKEAQMPVQMWVAKRFTDAMKDNWF